MYSYNINVALGNVLRRYRESRHMTQEEFSEICETSEERKRFHKEPLDNYIIYLIL